jgi:transcriptional regulator with XRE-family HTH domain
VNGQGEIAGLNVRTRPLDRLRYERQLRGWSQAELARQIGAKAASEVSRWERGVVSPSRHYQQKLCEVLDLNAEELEFMDAPQEPADSGEAADDRVVRPPQEPGDGEKAASDRRVRPPQEPADGEDAADNRGVAPSSSKRRWRAWYGVPAATLVGIVLATVLLANVNHAPDWPAVSYDLHSKKTTVRVVQWLLRARGFDVGSTGPDGVFGSATEAAVRSFQQSQSLPATGAVDGPTWEHLIIACGPSNRGSQVDALQEALNADGASSPISVDGDYGPSTESAVRRVQSAYGMRATGYSDLNTWRSIVQHAKG